MILKKPQITETDLSKAEQNVASLLSKGYSNAAIAMELEISEKTVKFHLTSVYRKTGVTGDREFLAAQAGYRANFV